MKTANHPFITIQADKVPFKIPILPQNDKVGQLCDKIKPGDIFSTSPGGLLETPCTLTMMS